MLSERLRAGDRWTLVGGKGGVGKTTVCAALAVELAGRGEPVLALSTDPAHSLGDALAAPLGPDPEPVPGVPGLRAMELDAARERRRFLARHGEALVRVVDRGTWLEEGEVRGLLDLPLPGADELAAVLRLLEWMDAPAAPRVLVDTAPTGHMLRLLDAPALVRGWLGALDAMEAKHGAVAAALGGAYRPDEAARFLDALRADLDRFAARLADPRATRFVLVTTPEPVVLAESARLAEELRRRGVALGGVVVNRSAGAPPPLPWAGDAPLLCVAALDREPVGPEGLRAFSAAAGGFVDAGRAPQTGGSVRAGPDLLPVQPRPLFLVAGKGGVGKTTVASALAAQLAGGGAEVLLLSTDPAGSLGDVWETEVGAEPRPAPGVPGLQLQQVDAAAAWEAFRARHRGDAEALVGGLVGGGASAGSGADAEVLARMVDLAPPGVDELMALEAVADRLEEGEAGVVVLDTAPTGHLLRFLEAPGEVLEWTHALLRLLLRYRNVVGLGDAAERLLRFARSLRALRDALADPGRMAVWVVALPDALGVAETRRLLARLEEMRMSAELLLVNRMGEMEEGRAFGDGHAVALAALAAGRVAAAPRMGDGPAGAAALEGFARAWRRLEREDG